MTCLNRLEVILNQIGEQEGKIRMWIPLIEDDFEFQGQRYDDIDTLKEFTDEFEQIIQYREQWNNIYIEGKSLIKIYQEKNIIADVEELESRVNRLNHVYNKLEGILLKRYREDNVSEFIMSGTKRILKKVGFKIKGIPIIPTSIPDGFIVEEIEDDAEEYVFEIYKNGSSIHNLEAVLERLEEIINKLLNEMLVNKEDRTEIYSNFMYKQIDKINAKNTSMEYKLDLENEPLYHWQREAYRAWRGNEYKGTFEVATGCGKTKFALYAIQNVKEHYSDIKIKIIVPTKALMNNWYDNLTKKLHIQTKNIGRRGDNRNEKDRAITIYIDKTAQGKAEQKFKKDFLRTIGDNMINSTNHFNFIIADECHHYESPENIKMFDKINLFPKDPSTGINYFSIALSATLPNGYNEHGKLKDYLGNTVYTYSFMNALVDDIISPINIVDVAYKLNIDEQKKFHNYKKELIYAEDELKKVFNKYNISFNEQGLSSIAYYILKDNQHILNYIEEKKLELQQQYGDIEWKEYFDEWIYEVCGKKEEVALTVKNYIGKYERLKKLLLNAEDRRKRCLELARKHIDDKVIIFGEYIDSIRDIYLELVDEFGNEKVKLYHSQLDRAVKGKVMDSFKLDTTKIICVPTALDEGVDIPDMSVGIVYQGKRSKRQQIQRLGRIMRKAKGKKAAIMYNLCNPSYSEPRFLERFIGEEVQAIQDTDGAEERLEKINERLNIDFIKYDHPIEVDSVVEDLIKRIRS